MGAYIDTNNEFRLIGSESASLKELTNFLQERCNNIADCGTHPKSSGILLDDDGDGYIGCDTKCHQCGTLEQDCGILTQDDDASYLSGGNSPFREGVSQSELLLSGCTQSEIPNIGGTQSDSHQKSPVGWKTYVPKTIPRWRWKGLLGRQRKKQVVRQFR